MRIQITAIDLLGNSASHDRGTDFEIDSTPPSVATNALISPNGTEDWTSGVEHNITWEKTRITGGDGDISLQYSTDSGSSWTEIDIGLTVEDDELFAWTVPNPGSTTSTVQVQVTVIDDVGNPASDSSDGDFTITVP